MSDRRNKTNNGHEPGQVENRNFTPMLKAFYLKEDTADAFFLFTKSDDQIERVPAHKLLLSTSEKFAKLFADADDGQTEFKIDDTSAEAFKEFLQFFYMPKFKLTFENIAAIMALAKDYGREEMLTECTIYLNHKLTTENMIWGYGLAIRFDRPVLKKNCEQKIVDNAVEVFKSNDFLECDRDVLNEILQLDSLKCDESQVLLAGLQWAKSTAKRKSLDSSSNQVLREEFGDLLFKIRFKSITIESFATIVGLFNGFFTGTDLQEIIQLIGLKDYKSETFNSQTRSVVSIINNNINNNNNNGISTDGNITGVSLHGTNNPSGAIGDGKYRNDYVMYGNRYSGCCKTRYYIQKVEKTRFEAQKPLKLVGLTFAQVYNAKNDAKVNVEAKVTVTEEEEGNEQNAAEVFQSMVTLSSERDATLTLCCPVPIEPSRKYAISVELDTKDELYNQFEFKTKLELKNGVKVRFLSNENKGYEDAKFGLIAKLQFKRG